MNKSRHQHIREAEITELTSKVAPHEILVLSCDPPLSPTEVQLVAVHRGPVVPLRDVCKTYFNLSYHEACRAAAMHELPVPVFKLTPKRSAPLMVHVAELAKYIDEAAKDAAKQWAKSQP